MSRPRCFLAPYSDRPCTGHLIKAHLLPQQLLKREGHAAAAHDPRSYVLACGGPMGNAGHHGMLDQTRNLRIPRHALPTGLEELAAELGLDWWLDREYGPRPTLQAATTPRTPGASASPVRASHR